MKKVCEFEVLELYLGMPGNIVNELNFNVHGIIEDIKHYGPTRISNPRVRKGAPKVDIGDIDENWRMFSAVSIEDIEIIKNNYKNEYNKSFEKFSPKYLGANFVINGINNSRYA